MLKPFDSANPTLTGAYQQLANRMEKKGRLKIDSIVSGRWLSPKELIVRELERQGILRIEKRSFLGFPTLKTPTVDSRPEHQLRQRLVQVIEGSQKPTDTEVAVLCLVKEMNAIKAVFGRDLPNRKPKDIKNRIRFIAENFGHEASKDTAMALRRAIQAVAAAGASAAAAGAVVATS